MLYDIIPYKAPGSPADVEITILNHDNQIQVFWSPPDMSNCTDVEEYRVTCYSWDDVVTEWTSSTMITLLNSSYFNSDYYFFHCCVSGNNSVGLGPQSCAQRKNNSIQSHICIYWYFLLLFSSSPHSSKKCKCHSNSFFTDITASGVGGTKTYKWKILCIQGCMWND